MPFLTIKEFKEKVTDTRKANCLAFALSITQFEYTPTLNCRKPIKDAFRDKCFANNITIKKELSSYNEVLATDGYVIVVWGFFPIRTLWGIEKSDFHVARRRPDGVWEHIWGIGDKPEETSWETLTNEYPEEPIFFEVEKC